jgi:predicted DNA binding CopG/RHH family protein
MKTINTITYDKEELELLDFIENEAPNSVPHVAMEIERLKGAVKSKLSKRKTINLRPLENDLEKIKTEAIKAGMPYQTLIRCYYSSIC